MKARVLILGGGISGLAAAYRVRELSIAKTVPVEVTILERHRIGGCIETRRERGYLMEMGAESLPRQKPHALALVDRLGLHDGLLATRAENKGTLIAYGSRLRRLPNDFSFFTPGSLASLFASGLFGMPGTMRAALEPFVPRRRTEADESVASFVRRRMGSSVLERLAQPLVGGIYSGDPQRLSMQATLPNFLELERTHGSLVRGLKAMHHSAKPGLVTMRDGMEALVDALERNIGAQAFVRAQAVTLNPSPEGGLPWEVMNSNGTRMQAHAVICALPACDAATLVAAFDRQLSAALQEIRYNSIAVVTFAFDAVAATLPRAHGVLVPFTEGRHVTAITLSSLKYVDRAPPGGLLLRAYVGGALQSELLERDDDELVELALTDVRALLRIRENPGPAIVRRWMRALPEYEVGHLERVAQIEGRVAAFPGLALTGAAYRGVGVSDCIASAEVAAEHVMSGLGAYAK